MESATGNSERYGSESGVNEAWAVGGPSHPRHSEKVIGGGVVEAKTNQCQKEGCIRLWQITINALLGLGKHSCFAC